VGNLLCSFEKQIASNKTHKIMWRSSLKKKYRTKMIIQHDSYGHFAWSVASSCLQQITRAKTLQIPGKFSTLSRFDHHVWVLSLNTNGAAGFSQESSAMACYYNIVCILCTHILSERSRSLLKIHQDHCLSLCFWVIKFLCINYRYKYWK